MYSGRYRVLVALCGVLGVAGLGFYFGAAPPLPPASASAVRVAAFAGRYHDLLMLGAWFQAVGSLLSVIFFLALVRMAGAAGRLAGLTTVLGSAVLLAVALSEGTLLIDVVQAAADGHRQAALSSYVLQGQFIHVFPIVPAPVVYLSLGAVILGSRVLPRTLGYLALALGAAFEVVGFVGLFVAVVNVGVVFLLIAQEVWIVAAAITLVVRRDEPGGTVRAEGRPA